MFRFLYLGFYIRNLAHLVAYLFQRNLTYGLTHLLQLFLKSLDGIIVLLKLILVRKFLLQTCGVFFPVYGIEVLKHIHQFLAHVVVILEFLFLGIYIIQLGHQLDVFLLKFLYLMLQQGYLVLIIPSEDIICLAHYMRTVVLLMPVVRELNKSLTRNSLFLIAFELLKIFHARIVVFIEYGIAYPLLIFRVGTYFYLV